jgi:hypothetical protein
MSPLPHSHCCPHCSSVLQAFVLPENSEYDSEVHLACFNNDCPYYREGWTWMREKYAVNASYRYRMDPANNVASPIAVWSEAALVERIVDLKSET